MDLIAMQSDLESEVNELQVLQREMQKYTDGRGKLVEQQSESEIVKKEVDLLEEDANIFKLVGPVLVKQTSAESKSTIDKRLDFITKELKKVDGLIKENENKQIQKRNKIQKLQENYYKSMMAQQQQQQQQQQKN